MKCQLILIVALFCLNSYSEARKIPSHHIQERALGDGTAAAPGESPESLLMRLKLLTYTEKLKAKEAKKKAKADKKAAKDAAFAAYLGSFLPPTAPVAGAAPASPVAAPAAPLSPLAALLAPAAPPSPAAPLPPMLPGLGMGLFKKTFIFTQLLQAAQAAQTAAAAQAAAAAAALTTTTSTVAPILETLDEATTAPASDEDEDETINEIVKRYAPALRKQFYGSEYPAAKHYNKDNEENNSEQEQNSDEEDSQAPNSRSGSYSKFGTGPAGSPNGVGYDDGKINQAGCSGSHIHICSGTTVYLRNPDDDSTGQLGQAIEMGADDEEGTAPDNNEEAEQDESEEKSKHKKKHHH